MQRRLVSLDEKDTRALIYYHDAEEKQSARATGNIQMVPSLQAFWKLKCEDRLEELQLARPYYDMGHRQDIPLCNARYEILPNDVIIKSTAKSFVMSKAMARQ